jgi:hypothetical protein
MSGSKWTRQTYMMVAQCIRDVHNSLPSDNMYGDSVVAALVDNLSLQFKLDNAAFDSVRFGQACTLVNKRGPLFRDS